MRSQHLLLSAQEDIAHIIFARGMVMSDNNEFNSSISKGAQGRKRHGKKNSEYIGVRLMPYVRQWHAVIKYANKNYFLGSYEKEEYAAYAYDKKAIELYGTEARVNFPHLSYEELAEKLAHIEEENKAIFSQNLSKRHQGRRFSNVTKKSEYVGVSSTKPGAKKPWRATICYQNKQYTLGAFLTEKEAAMAYDKKAVELYGENARVNFPAPR